MRANEEAEPVTEVGWIGTTIGGRYEILGLIGAGGMGTVFRARDGELEEVVALKVLRRDLVEIPGTVERFRREVKLARRVTHRNVARVFDIGEHNGDKFLTMELVEGEPLNELMRRGPVPWDDAVRICLAIAEGLTAAHAAGVVHRDLKPENVLLAKDGRVVITDFGIARAHIEEGSALHTVGSALGTPAYMAPEQVEPDREVDARADIYAFGALMFEMFTGRRAWPGESAIAVAAARVLKPPPDPRAVRPDLPQAYAEIISRCLQRSPADRFQTAERVALVLRIPNPWLPDQRTGGAGAAMSEIHTAPTVPRSLAAGSQGIAGSVAVSAAAPGPGSVAVSFAGGSSASGVVAGAASRPAPTPGRAPGPLATLASPTPAGPVHVAVTSPVSSAPAQSGVTGVAATPSETGAPGSPRSLAATTSQPASAPRTVAVLPFRNTGGAEDEYLADGLTDELIDTLSMTPGLRVRSRGVVMQHKGTDADPREVGARLDVGLVVEGSIRRTPAGVRITARVVSVRDGSQLWAKRFDRSTIDVFVVSDEVARAVAEALTLDGTAPAREAPADPEAMDLYLRGRLEYRKYWPDNVKNSVGLFQEALARAPDHPTILSAHALACARLWWFGGESGAQAAAAAHDSAERALSAAPHLGEPHLALSQVMWNHGDSAGAARHIQRAIARGPTLAEAHALKGRILVEANALDAGMKSLSTALTLDPAVPLAAGELARGYAFLGKWDEVAALAERTGQNEGPLAMWFARARYSLWRRDRAAAAMYLEQIDQDPRVVAVARWMLEQVLATAPPAEVIDLGFFMPRADASMRRRTFMLQIEAEVRAFHGQLSAALASVRRSVDQGLFDLAWLERCPLLAPLHGEAELQAARAEVGERVRAVMGEME